MKKEKKKMQHGIVGYVWTQSSAVKLDPQTNSNKTKGDVSITWKL